MRPSMIATVVSMLALAPAVNTFAEEKATSTPPHQESGRHESDLKDSVKSSQSELSRLVQALLVSGRDVEAPNGFAQVIGLDQPTPTKMVAEPFGAEARKCSVPYAPDETGNSRAICLYFIRAKKTKHDLQEQYFRVSLDGKLEKVVTLRSKYDEQGKTIRSERSKFDEDIDSPEIKNIFKTDMAFWVKDWLKKQQKLMAKADATAAEKSEDDAVKASASAGSKALDKEAATTAPQAGQ